MHCGNQTHGNCYKSIYVTTTTNGAVCYHISSLSPHVGTKTTTTSLRVVRSTDWPDWANVYILHQLYHSSNNIHSDPAIWDQLFYLHWSNLILSYQHICKPLTLQWRPIEDTDPLRQSLAYNLEKKGGPKHTVTYGYQCRYLHWRIWQIIRIHMVRECTEALSDPYSCLLFISILLFHLWLYQLSLYWHVVLYRVWFHLISRHCETFYNIIFSCATS